MCFFHSLLLFTDRQVGKLHSVAIFAACGWSCAAGVAKYSACYRLPRHPLALAGMNRYSCRSFWAVCSPSYACGVREWVLLVRPGRLAEQRLAGSVACACGTQRQRPADPPSVEAAGTPGSGTRLSAAGSAAPSAYVSWLR